VAKSDSSMLAATAAQLSTAAWIKSGCAWMAPPSWAAKLTIGHEAPLDVHK